MYDSSVRSAIGIESGIAYQFGHYDQCLHIDTSKSLKHESPVKAKYCLVDINVEGLTPLQSGTRDNQVKSCICLIVSYD